MRDRGEGWEGEERKDECREDLGGCGAGFLHRLAREGDGGVDGGRSMIGKR